LHIGNILFPHASTNARKEYEGRINKEEEEKKNNF